MHLTRSDPLNDLNENFWVHFPLYFVLTQIRRHQFRSNDLRETEKCGWSNQFKPHPNSLEDLPYFYKKTTVYDHHQLFIRVLIKQEKEFHYDL